ncbi:hypothetical protein SAMN04487939_10729 [Lysobacter sp. yr284]|nr:hypothetical protein SAMN04487939_10729 [Lysobacter sp. yr284]
MADAGRPARRRPAAASGIAALPARAPCCGLPSPLASAIKTTVALSAAASAVAAPAASPASRKRSRSVA